MRQLFQRMGFSQAAATAVVDDQGIDSLAELRILKDDEITNLCKIIRRPGGQIVNPGPQQQGQIPNPGISVSLRAENNTKLARYFITHRDLRISRPCQAGDVTLAAVRDLQTMKDQDATHVNPEEKPTVNDKDWPKTFESIEQYFVNKRGELSLPLAYVIREQGDPANAADDPANTYATPVQEMIARAPHVTNGNPDPIFILNSGMVLDDLADMFRDTLSWTYMKDFVRTRDGRGAYRALYQHYLGPNMVNNLSAAAETALSNTSYNGEGRRWNFEKYVTSQKKQHQVLEGLTRYGYSGIDPRTKVRYLISGIKTKDLDAPTTNILGSPTLQVNYDAAVTLYKDYINQSTNSGSLAPTRNVSMTTATQRGEPEDRYYSPAEYAALSNDQKEQLRQARRKRGHKPGAKDSTVLPGQANKKAKAVNKRTVAALTKANNALAKRLEKLEKGTTPNVPDVVSTDGSSTQGTNSANPALTRQK